MEIEQYEEDYSQPFPIQPDASSMIPEEKTYDVEGKSIKFEVLVKFFNRFTNMRGVKKSTYVKEFLKILFKADRSPSFVYPIMRLMLPADDRDRGNYGLRQKNLSKAIADSLSLTKDDYLRLHYYKNPSFHKNGVGVGDFSLCVYDVIKKYCKQEASLTVGSLNAMLDDLVDSQKGHLSILRRLFTVCTAEQIKWIIRIILKDLKANVKIDTILKAFHADAHDFFNLTNSLYETCKKFQDPNVSLDDEIKIFFPIRPMLAGKKKINYFQNNSKVYYVQTKYDGQRLQAHKKGSQVKLFSRNAVDYSKIYYQFVEVIKMYVNTDDCILDGQIVVVEKDSFKMVPFGMNKVIALNKESEQHRLCYKIFDILWLNLDGQDINLMKYELRQRKQLLSKIIIQKQGVIEIVKFDEIYQYDSIIKRFSQSLDRSQEGIMLKDPQSMYIPKQRGLNWTKLKGDYIQGLTDTLDLIILGGYFGDSAARYGPSSHWSDQVTSFLLGVLDRADLLNDDEAYAIPFAKVGTGYSLEQLNRLRSNLKQNLVKNDSNYQPTYMNCKWKPSLHDRPDCWVKGLSRSVILQVKAAEMIVSDSYPTGHTLRFPRVVKIRYDKDWNEAETVKNIQQMTNTAVYSKHLKRKMEDNDSNNQQDEDKQVSEKTVKKVKLQKQPRRQGVYQQYIGFDFKNENLMSHLFSGFQFCVFSLFASKYQKHEIQREIMLHDGKVIQNPMPSTNYIVCDTIDFKLRAYHAQKDRKFTFIGPNFIIGCIRADKILRLSPLYLTILPTGNARYYMENFDRFGDSYTDYLDIRELDQIIEYMNGSYHKNDKLLQQLCIKKLRSGKISMCLGISYMNKVKLKIAGNVIVDSFEDLPNTVIIEGKLMPYELEAINRYRQINNDVEIQFVEDLIDMDII